MPIPKLTSFVVDASAQALFMRVSCMGVALNSAMVPKTRSMNAEAGMMGKPDAMSSTTAAKVCNTARAAG